MVIGAMNGIIPTVARVPRLVVTLAALYSIRGVDAVIVSGKQIDPTSIPRAFQALGYKTIFGLPWLALIVAGIILAAGYAMRSFRASRDLYAIGSSPAAAPLARGPAAKSASAA